MSAEAEPGPEHHPRSCWGWQRAPTPSVTCPGLGGNRSGGERQGPVLGEDGTALPRGAGSTPEHLGFSVLPGSLPLGPALCPGRNSCAAAAAGAAAWCPLTATCHPPGHSAGLAAPSRGRAPLLPLVTGSSRHVWRGSCAGVGAGAPAGQDGGVLRGWWEQRRPLAPNSSSLMTQAQEQNVSDLTCCLLWGCRQSWPSQVAPHTRSPFPACSTPRVQAEPPQAQLGTLPAQQFPPPGCSDRGEDNDNAHQTAFISGFDRTTSSRDNPSLPRARLSWGLCAVVKRERKNPPHALKNH